MMSKLKRSRVAKMFSAFFMALSIAAMSCLTCFATGDEQSSSADMAQIMSNSFQAMQSDIFGYVAVALPIALTIVGAFFGIKKAINFFQKTANKGG